MVSTALVLGGGGVTGIAWELGLLAGLAEAGLDLTDAGLLVGTSAGSVVAALVGTGVDLEAAFASQLAPPGAERSASFGPGLMARFAWSSIRSRSPGAFAVRLGRVAVAATTVPEAERRAIIAARLPSHEWPQRRLLITAVDVESGELKVFDRDAGASLVDAVAASCAVPGVWPPVSLEGRRYMDGGMASVANAHLAAGASRVVVLAPLPGGIGPLPSVAAQAAELVRAGSTVSVLSPDAAARAAIGTRLLDVSRRAGAARAGRAQATAALAALRATWGGQG
jgi:NTE family protein